MTRSVRISDELYQGVQRDAEVMCRSIGQQLEFLARLGLALEGSPGITAQQLRALAGHAAGLGLEPLAEEELEAAFTALASMDGNPELERRLSQGETPVPGRDAQGRLVYRRLDPGEDFTAAG